MYLLKGLFLFINDHVSFTFNSRTKKRWFPDILENRKQSDAFRHNKNPNHDM